ncbi:hypothetical protein BCAR13_410092 [Paraburkholderia caribensis]|nr:hypothetical protein BCAR13_410092 [Paraburkholderia caribensis]
MAGFRVERPSAPAFTFNVREERIALFAMLATLESTVPFGVPQTMIGWILTLWYGVAVAS